MAMDQGDSKTLWQKTKRSSKVSFDRLWGYSDKYIGAPVNRLSNKLGSEAFWPSTLDKEADKAARILRSFCKDGFYAEEPTQPVDGPKGKQRVVKKIPMEVIKNARGLAIFTTMRTGLWFSGAGGSGVLVARKKDGTWSPPAGIMLHTAGLGFLVGVDIYDCVLVLNTDEAVGAFSKWRATIGGEMSAVAGPVGVGGILDSEVNARRAPVFTYLKSRGFYAGVQVDGTVIIERSDENERFYGEKLSAAEIVSGKVRHPPWELNSLKETLKAAEGAKNVDLTALPNEPPPADFEVVASDHVFGVPDKEDPDPYGVLALEKEGFYIKEAGTKARPSEEEFEFRPAVSSPVFSSFNRRSFDTSSQRSSWRKSTHSNGDRISSYFGTNRNYVTADIATQTDLPPITPGELTSSPLEDQSMNRLNREVDGVEDEKSATRLPAERPPPLPPRRPKMPQPLQEVAPEPEPEAVSPVSEMSEVVGADKADERTRDEQDDADGSEADPEKQQERNSDDEEDDEGPEEEEPVVHVIHQAAKPQTVNKARVVQVQKRPPPQLPPRNPGRMRTAGTQSGEDDSSSLRSVTSGTAEESADKLQSSPSSPEKETRSNQSGSSHEEPQVSPPTTPARSPSFRSVKSEIEPEGKDGVPGSFPQTSLETEESELPSPVSEEAGAEEARNSAAASDTEPTVDETQSKEGLQEPSTAPGPHVSMANIRQKLDSDDDD